MIRTLGKSEIKVSALGLGCWPIGGLWTAGDGKTPLGYGAIDDSESIRAIHAAIEAGVNFYDTANIYGCGHSEKILGQAVKDRRDKVVISTKFSTVFDEDKKIPLGNDNSPEGIRKACDDSLRRLDTDYIDLYLFHDWGHPAEEAEPVRATLEELVQAGKIRSYGWSTDLIPSIEAFNKSENNTAAQIVFNAFEGNGDLLRYCEKENLAAMARSPLAMGLLSGRYDKSSSITGGDIRSTDTEWMTYFQKGKAAESYLDRLDAIKEILRSDGRSLVQGALAWLWGRSEALIPIPGFKNTKQAVENAKAMEFGPLSKDQVEEVERLVDFKQVFTT